MKYYFELSPRRVDNVADMLPGSRQIIYENCQKFVSRF